MPKTHRGKMGFKSEIYLNIVNSEIYSNLNLYRKLWINISNKLKNRAKFTVFIIILNGISEIISIAALFPFLTIISNKELIYNIQFVNNFLKKQNLINNENLIIFLTSIFLISVIFTMIIRLLNIYLINKYASEICIQINSKLYSNLMNRPYSEIINDNSSNIISIVITYGNQLVTIIQSIFNFISTLVISFIIVISLFIFNWQITLVTATSYIFIYNIFIINANKKVNIISKYFVKSNNIILKNIQINLGAIRDIILSNSGDIFYERYNKINREYRKKQAFANLLITSPKYIVEGFTLIIIATLACYLQINQNNLYFLPILGAFALAVQKLLPMLQLLFVSYSSLQLYKSALQKIVSVLDKKSSLKDIQIKKNKNFTINKGLSIKNIHFQYPNKKENTLKISL